MATKKTRKAIFNDYDGFVEKFKQKKTTDDCYTPEPVYQAVREWVNDNILPLDGIEVVRPFWPGGDYESFDYPENCVVIDNPPFSILAKIRRFYHERNIRYFLFAPTLVMANSAKELDSTFIICGSSIVYENGAKVNTSFITNLDCGDLRVWVAGGLSKKIEEVQKVQMALQSVNLPSYEYPDCVISPAIIQKVSKQGIELKIKKQECSAITSLDSQKGSGKALFGGGWLISERAAAERAAAVEKIVWPLSEREKKIIKSLG